MYDIIEDFEQCNEIATENNSICYLVIHNELKSHNNDNNTISIFYLINSGTVYKALYKDKDVVQFIKPDGGRYSKDGDNAVDLAKEASETDILSSMRLSIDTYDQYKYTLKVILIQTDSLIKFYRDIKERFSIANPDNYKIKLDELNNASISKEDIDNAKADYKRIVEYLSYLKIIKKKVKEAIRYNKNIIDSIKDYDNKFI